MMEMNTIEHVQRDARHNITPPTPVDVSGIPIITYIAAGAAGGDGHHDDYDRLFATVASDIGVSMRFMPRSSSVVQRHGTWFYSMFDTSPTETARALLAASLRSFAGQKTIGLVFRPGDCFIKRSFKSSVRRTLFRIVARLRNVNILIIIPFAISPEMSSVASNWIYDPQLWDLQYLGVPDLQNVESLQAQIRGLAGNRLILVALGPQYREKGFDFLVDLWLSSPELRASHLFVACGRVMRDSKAAANRFQEAGGVLLDRRIDDAELFALYGIADLVWSCYAPDNDRSSGIHGRAVQFGVPVVVRRGSYLDAFGETLSHPSLALPFGINDEAIPLLLRWSPRRVNQKYTESLVRRMRDHSLSVLANALRG
jgi:hypothetical protein